VFMAPRAGNPGRTLDCVISRKSAILSKLLRVKSVT
jgi:hypothetical protein